MEQQEVSLYDLALLVRKHWRTLAVTTAIVSAAALAVAFLSDTVYRAQTIVPPLSIDQPSAPGLSALGGSLGGLASLAGIEVGQGAGIEQNLAILRSRNR